MSENSDLFHTLPFGTKTVGNINIDFDQVYSEVIFPVSEMAGVRMIQAGEYLFESSFQSVATEQMLRADVVVADISGANPNVLYQVGLRHAARSNVTLLLSGAGRGAIRFAMDALHRIRSGINLSGVERRVPGYAHLSNPRRPAEPRPTG